MLFVSSGILSAWCYWIAGLCIYLHFELFYNVPPTPKEQEPLYIPEKGQSIFILSDVRGQNTRDLFQPSDSM